MPDLKYMPVSHDHHAFLEKAMERKDFKIAYEELKEEYNLAREMIAARIRSGLSQEAVADMMGTTTSNISRLESAGKLSPSISTLNKYAQAVGCHLQIKLIPDQCKLNDSKVNC